MQAVVNLPKGSTTRLGRGRILDLAFSPDGEYLVVGSSIGVWWYKLPAVDPIALWDTERGMITAIAFSPDGQWLATGDGDGLLKVWDVQKRVCVAQMDRPDTEKDYHWVSQIAFSPDSQWVAAASQRDYILYVWDWETGEQVAKFHEETNFRWFGGFRRPVAFSKDGRLLACTMPDEKLLACADPDGSIRTPKHTRSFVAVWDVETGERLSCLRDPINFTGSLNFSPCGQFLAAGENAGTVRVWAVSNWELLQETVFNDETYRMRVSYSPEGVLYAMGTSDNAVTMWDVERQEKCYAYLEDSGNIECAHFTDGNQLVIVTEREIKIWTSSSSQESTAAHFHTGAPDSLVFSGDGKTLAGGYWKKGVMLWDVGNPLKYPTCFHLPGGNHSVSVSSTGTIYVLGSDRNTAKVWEIDDVERSIASFTLPDSRRNVTGIAFAPTNKILACGDNEGLLYIRDIQREKILHSHPAHDSPIHSITFSRDEKHLVSTTREGPESVLWDVALGEKIDEFPSNGIDTIAFSPESDLIAGGRRKEILLWDLRCREVFMILPHDQGSWWASALAFSPCGEYLASGASWQRGMNIKKVAVRLWSVATGENIATFRGHPTDIQCLAFSPDGRHLASGSYDGTILLWDMTPYL